MAQCLIKNSEYWTKLEQSGIPEFDFYSFANNFVAKHGRFPNLDEIPEADSSKSLMNTFHVKKNSVKIQDVLDTTQTNNIKDANIFINDMYSDLEVEFTPLNKEALIYISHKPSEYVARDINNFDMNPNANLGVVFNSLFDKLRNLYGINIIPITNKELNSDIWKNIPDVKSASAFVYNNQIYINTDVAQADAPIHEMTHILLGMTRFKNPELYFELVEMSEKFPNFKKLAFNNPNKTKSDVCEEVFVQEVSKYLAGLPSEINKLDQSIQFELNYDIKRLLDSVLMGKYSVKSINDNKLYQMSLIELVKVLQSNIMNPKTMGSLDNAALHRMLNNKKSQLLKEGKLREEC